MGEFMLWIGLSRGWHLLPCDSISYVGFISFSYDYLENCMHYSFFNPFLYYTNFSYFHEYISGASPLNWTVAFFWCEIHFARCMYHNYHGPASRLFWVFEVVLCGIGAIKLYVGT
jgi:hypothetical protein